jgi:rhodanese-related sulfurtransferase
VVVYDARGQRATMAGGDLKAAGFTQLYSLNGGFKAWTDAGLPVEKV